MAVVVAQGRVPDPEAVLRGHPGEVQALDFDPSERFLFSGDSVGEVWVWDLQTQRPLAKRRLHTAAAGVLHLRLFRCAGLLMLATQGRDGLTQLWRCSDDGEIAEEPERVFAHDCYSFCRFSVLAPPPPLPEQPGPAPDPGAVFVSSLLASDSDGEEQQTGQGAAEPQEHEPQQPGPDGQQQQQQQQQQPASAAEAVAALHPHCPQARDPFSPPALLALPGGDEKCAEVVCCACGEQLALLHQQQQQSQQQQQGAVPGSNLGMLMALALFAAPGEQGGGVRLLLAAGHEEGSLAVWEVASPQRPLAVRRLHEEPVMALEVDPAGRGGVCGAAERQITIFRLRAAAAAEGGCGSEAALGLEMGGRVDVRREGVGDLAIRPDGKLMASGGWDGRARLYKYRSGRPLAILKYHRSPIAAVRFSPSGLLATGARDGTIALWPLYQPAREEPPS